MTEEELEAQEEQELIDAMMEESEQEIEEVEDNETSEEESDIDGQSEEEDDTGNSGDGYEDESETSSEGEVDDETNDDDSEQQESTSDFEPITVQVNGYDVEITSKEDMMAYIKKGADSFNSKPDKYVEEKNIVEQGQLSPEDLKLLVDAKNGSKEAIAKLAEIAQVDVLDLEAEQAEQYKNQFEPTVQSEVDIVANEILADEAHANDFRSITGTLPADFTEQVFSDATIMKNFSRHIKEGLAQKIIPQAISAQIARGGSFMDHYSQIGQAMVEQAKQPQRQVNSREQELRKKANTRTRNSVDKSSSANTANDVWDLTDEEFAEKFGG